MIGSFLLILSVGFSALLCHRHLADQFRDARITLVSASLFWISAKIYSTTWFPFSETVEDVSLIITGSVLLMSLLMMIRSLKPEVFRYPYITVFMPLVIPVSYYLIYQTSLIRDTILHSVLGTIVVVTMIISIGYRNKVKPFLSVVVGGILLATSIAVTVFLQTDQYIHFVWYLITSAGIALVSYGFIFTFNRNIDV